MSETNAEIIARVWELVGRATPGPWRRTKYNVTSATRPITAYDGGDDELGQDYEFIAESRKLLPDLATLLDAADTTIAELLVAQDIRATAIRRLDARLAAQQMRIAELEAERRAAHGSRVGCLHWTSGESISECWYCQQAARIETLVALLRRLEWRSYPEVSSLGVCVSCQHGHDEGHAPACAFVAAVGTEKTVVDNGPDQTLQDREIFIMNEEYVKELIDLIKQKPALHSHYGYTELHDISIENSPVKAETTGTCTNCGHIVALNRLKKVITNSAYTPYLFYCTFCTPKYDRVWFPWGSGSTRFYKEFEVDKDGNRV